MAAYELVPHQGAAPLKLGMSREEVLAVAEEREWRAPTISEQGDLHYGFRSAGPRVYFGEAGVELIEFWSDAEIEVVYRGTSVFDTTARTLMTEISNHEKRLGYEPTEPWIEAPSKPLSGMVVFRGEIVVLARAAKQYDYRGKQKRPIFATVGVGSRKYLMGITGSPWVPPTRLQTGGKRYRHGKLGTATLVSKQNDTLELLFDDGTTRRMKESFVEPIS